MGEYSVPSLSFFMDKHDLRLLLNRLNADPEIAFIVSDEAHEAESQSIEQPRAWGPIFQVQRNDGEVFEWKGLRSEPQRWKAVRTVDIFEEGEHSLWHLPAGPLPLISMDASVGHSLVGMEGPGYTPVPDPWAGWIGPSGFGPGCHPWIRLEVWTRHQPY